MKKQSFHSVNTIRFRRWSRKSYAVFAGLNKVISIGRVSSSISDMALLKNKILTDFSAATCLQALAVKAEESEDETPFAVLPNPVKILSNAADAPVGCNATIYNIINLKL